MSRKELPNPHLTMGKVILAALYGEVVFAFFSWLFRSTLWNPAHQASFRGNFNFPPLEWRDILVGIGFGPLFLWLHWAWRSRHKNAHWHRWLGTLLLNVYLLTIFLLAGIASWTALLNDWWRWFVAGIFVLLFLLAWILPTISYTLTKKLADMQWAFNLRILSYGGLGSLMVLAGILSANYGMHAYRNSGRAGVLVMEAILFSVIAVLGAQYSAEYLWRYRPWAKEEE